jgi:hypothetical protein
MVCVMEICLGGDHPKIRAIKDSMPSVTVFIASVTALLLQQQLAHGWCYDGSSFTVLNYSVEERLAKRLSLKRCSGYQNGFVDSVT